MKTADFDFELPEELIAQEPAKRREDARLLVVDPSSGSIEHARITDLPSFLAPPDVLVLNDTRVVQARIHSTRLTGAKIQALILRGTGTGRAHAMMRPLAKLKPGEPLVLDDGETRMVFEGLAPGALGDLSPPPGMTWEEVMERFGRPPLPPYIRRPFEEDPHLPTDRERYQTTFARVPGSVAAPTAGMHFTAGLFDAIRAKGVPAVHVTLCVGAGTFRPVKCEEVEDHPMESESFEVPEETVEAIVSARAAGGRCVAVGTTVVRSLETASAAGRLEAMESESRLFIRPPYEFRTVDALVTNFHLPRSTLLMLVSAFAGRDLVMRAYEEAVKERYRFFSYGDACLFTSRI